MANFPVSPGISTTETDLTTSIPAVATSIGGFVGTFNWGPVNYVTPVSNEVQLDSIFSDPDDTTAESFFTAADFLSYSNNLNVVRAQGTGMLNATGSNTGVAIEIDNPTIYFNSIYQTTLASNNYIARFPGGLGNSIAVITFANGAAWTAAATNPSSPYYTYANYFSWAPNTTPYVAQVTNGQVTGDELHILVVDAGGLITGKANSVLEVYQGLSRLKDGLDAYGNANYYKEVIWSQSNYIYNVGVPCSNTVGWGNTTAQQIGTGSFGNDASANVAQFANGNNGVVTSANVVTGLGLFADPTFVQVNLLMTGTSNTVVQNYAIQDVAAVRKDCVAFCSAPLSADQTSSGALTPVLAWGANVAYNSYAVLDTGYKYRYDKYYCSALLAVVGMLKLALTHRIDQLGHQTVQQLDELYRLLADSESKLTNRQKLYSELSKELKDIHSIVREIVRALTDKKIIDSGSRLFAYFYSLADPSHPVYRRLDALACGKESMTSSVSTNLPHTNLKINSEVAQLFW